ncbi:MAG: FAD-binding protein [Chloroflexi bacterium]|nr:FAD-binding protein [Chloroflexota bacterium]
MTNWHALSQQFPADRFSLTEADRQLHAQDQSSHAAHLPDAVVWPVTTAEVSAILRWASDQRVPVVGWGAGSSLEGNPIPVQGGLVVDFGRMNGMTAVYDQDFQVVVQPGILYKDMNKSLAQYGLFFAPDPGANASIGGMIANNAAGSRTVKYGATRDNVLALEVVLASGEIIRTGSRSVKQSAGYDLTHLFTGSEGTLGLITEATLKLAPLPQHFSAVVAAFPSTKHAAEAVFGIMGSGLGPAALELLDETSIGVLCSDGDFDFAIAPNLFMEFHGASEASLGEELLLVEEICRDCGAIRYQTGLGVESRNKLWEARHRLFEVFIRRFPGHAWLLTDVAVPISQYPVLVAYTSEQIERLGLACGIIGHAGDGNMHTAAFFPREDTTGWQRGQELNDLVVAKAIALGGTCTGEHGVGIGKQKYMVQEHGEAAVQLMRQIKATFDPLNILNPGKVV